MYFILRIALCSEEALSQEMMIADNGNTPKKDHFL